MGEEEKGVVINLAAIELAYSPSTSELLEFGTPGEVRQALGAIASLMERGNAKAMGPETQTLIGEALRRIASGESADKALGLTRKKKYGVWYAKNMDWIIQDLMRQGLPRVDAEDLVGRLNLEEAQKAKDLLRLEDIQSADEKIRKRIKRGRTK